MDISGYGDWVLAAQLCTDAQPVSCEDAALQLPAYAVAVLMPKQ